MNWFKALQESIHTNAVAKGFWDENANPDNGSIPSKIALIHSELSEALEAYRDGSMDTYVRSDGKPDGFAIELADAVIRIMDLAGHLDINLAAAIEAKHFYNLGRPYMHGGKKI